jgi:tetratricopeptide (TPR) repeat protein
MNDDDATRPAEKATVPPPANLFDDEEYGDDEATVMARIPDELLAESQRAEEMQGGGLKQMFSREGAHAPPPTKPAEPEGDALLDMLFDDARDDRKSSVAGEIPKAAPSRPEAPKPPPLPPPRPVVAAPAHPETPKPRAVLPPPRLHSPDDETIQMEAPSEHDAAAISPRGGPESHRLEAETLTSEAAPAAVEVAILQEPETMDINPAAFDDAPVVASAPAPVASTPAHAETAKPPSAVPVLPETPSPIEVSDAAEPDSVRPRAPAHAAPLPSRMPPPVAFEREEDASALLLRQQQRDAWVARAEWLKVEADAQADATTRARALLVVSELYAMSGEEATARAVAEEARKLAPSSPLAHRQVRGLVTRDGDWSAVLEVLDAETHASATPEAKCHGELLGAEIARICLSDGDGAKKRVEQALRSSPADPRAHVQRFCDALAAELDEATSDGSVPKPAPATRVKLPDLPELGPLPGAAQQVLAHRGLTPATAILKHATPPAGPAGSTYEALLRVRAAAAASDHAGVVAGLEGLARAPSLAGGAHWLAGVLGAVRKETRAQSVEALRAVAEGSHGALALRALAARAIELGDAEAARSATSSGDSDAFSAADRVALAALAGGGRDAIEPWLDTLLADPDLSAIAASANALVGGDSEPSLHAVGGARGRASATLGRALAASHPLAAAEGEIASGVLGLHRAVAGFADAAPETSLSRALTLELDVADGSGGKIARAISGWRDDSELERECALGGALVAEASGEIERAVEELGRVLRVDATCEAAARAATTYAEPEAAAKILAEHAQALEGGSRAAVLLVEAAVRLEAAGDANESDALLRRAVEADPELPLAHHLGERAARARGDREALVEWIRARRDGSPDPAEQAHDLVREALLVSEGDASAASPLLEAALRARPTDVALREIYERLAPEPPADRASWRAERAAETTGVEAARLWLDAALELERTGDLEGAARAAHQAIAAGEALLAPIAAYRMALSGHGTSEIVDQLLPKATETTDATERLELYERLAELDERGRGDAASGMLFRRTILEATPGHLPTLRRVASTLISAGRDEELETVAIDIARTLDGPESVAHAMLAARLHQRTGTWDETREAVEIAYKHQPRGLWALRQMTAHARARGEFPLAMEAERALIERTNRPSEAATLSIRAAGSALKSGMVEDALAFLAHAINLVPHHIVAHLELAAALEQTKNPAGAAASLEAAAAACASPAERARLLYRAAILWYDQVDDPPHAREALEAVAAIDPSYEDVFPRLQAIYVAAGARAELAALLERRLEAVTDPGERVEMEVLRGRALADVGDAAAAKRALAAALDANPDHVDALSAFGDVSAEEEDWSGAEQAWIRLARLVPEPERQAAIYFRLGDLYDERLPNPERAELAYQEILKHTPGDTKARERLVALYQKTGDSARAIEQQTLLVNAAEAPEAKCERTTQLASIYEAIGDAKKAEATLLQARKTWPKDDVALAALARFYLRNNQAQAANVLLDRAVADARRALGTGRFEPYLFSTIAAVAELRNRPDAARVAKAAVASLDGSDAALEGAGVDAADTKLDDLLAPEVLTLVFRDLLKKTGPLLDTAVPYDLTAVRAAPLPPQLAELGDLVHNLAAGYGLPGIQVFTSTVLGSVCLPVSTHPPVLVMGHPLVTSSRDDVKSFLIHRALKVLQANAAAISRTAPIDLWPLLAAYLKAFNSTWVPQGVDQGKLTDFYGRVSRALPKGTDAQVALLAAEVIGSIGNRASTLNTVINGWGNRAGLLAVGDLNVAITGIAWAGGHTNAPPATGKDRMTWIGRNAEARELVVFSVSDAYADARGRLGLALAEAEADSQAEEVEIID